MHIRCITNKYNLNVVIDVCEDTDFARLTANLDWIDIDGTAKPGDYYYNNKIISLDSDNYNIIEGIIHQAEEADRIAREAEVAAQIAAEEARLAEMQKLSEAEDEVIAEPVEILVHKLPDDVTKVKQEILSHPIPAPVNYFNDPQPEKFLLSDLDAWDHRVIESNRLISAVESSTWNDHVVTFDPPHRIAPGTEFEAIREYDIVPHKSKADYVSYLKATAENIKKYRDYVAAQLGRS